MITRLPSFFLLPVDVRVMSQERGISSLHNEVVDQKYKHLGTALSNEQKEQLLTQLQVFQTALISFQEEHSSEIINDEQIRTTFQEICSAFGIPPLVVASTLEGQEAEIERNNQLCLKMIELCTETRPINGGIITVDDLVELINEDSWVNKDLHMKFTSKDVLEACSHLKIMGGELQLIQIGKRNYIKSIPQELDVDQSTIIDTANILGYVSISILRDNFGWKSSRCRSTIDEMISYGILWVDKEPGHETKYWAASWINV
ncbi:uncharacterized protein C5L36_0C05170 [Pichia kudriavzevii]|uniref:Vacuolar-sorting protein SNF8 n=2 Tax=Pichia kudriavzevii TaxID=4909 RepID=A0A2U9R625_PICKU|nr:uncharacterized protein C5L36_0C05170 [Pichia kudriavzevii]AWU76586.1 hypothetical protein C5L36_0C05170 [Pichia kudriavzevii]